MIVPSPSADSMAKEPPERWRNAYQDSTVYSHANRKPRRQTLYPITFGNANFKKGRSCSVLRGSILIDWRLKATL